MSIHIHHVEPGEKIDDAAALEQFQHLSTWCCSWLTSS
jgi:hypothetical protein